MAKLVTLTEWKLFLYGRRTDINLQCNNCGKTDFKPGDRIYKTCGSRYSVKYFCEDHIYAEPRRLHE